MLLASEGVKKQRPHVADRWKYPEEVIPEPAPELVIDHVAPMPPPPLPFDESSFEKPRARPPRAVPRNAGTPTLPVRDEIPDSH